MPIVVSLAACLFLADDAWETLAKLRANIENVEFVYETTWMDPNRPTPPKKPPRDDGLLVRIHRDGVCYQLHPVRDKFDAQMYEESAKLGGIERTRSTMPHRGWSTTRRLKDAGSVNLANQLGSPMDLWPQLGFTLMNPKGRARLVRIGPEKRAGVDTERFELRTESWTSRYWLDLRRQGALIEYDTKFNHGRHLWIIFHSVEHESIPDGRGGVIWYPKRGVATRHDDNGKPDAVAIVEIPRKTLRVNTGRTAEAAQPQFPLATEYFSEQRKQPGGPLPTPTDGVMATSVEPTERRAVHLIFGPLAGILAIALASVACGWTGRAKAATRLARFAWIAAWTGWAFVGYGLYRELPREPSGVVTKVPRGRFLGFVGDTNAAVFLNWTDHKLPGIVRVRDVETGDLIREIVSPSYEAFLGDFQSSVSRGFLVAKNIFDPQTKKRQEGAYRLDLNSGEWRCLSSGFVTNVVVHDSQPWALIVEREFPLMRIARVALVDLESGEQLHEFRPTADWEIDDDPSFFTGGDRFVLQTTGQTTKSGVEIWRVGKPCVREKHIPEVYTGGQADISAAGRIACRDGANPTTIRVVDATTERTLFTLPGDPVTLASKTVGSEPVPTLSNSGRTFFTGRPAALWNVDTGANLWKPRASERIDSDYSKEYFVVAENWTDMLKAWQPKSKLEFYAVRSMETGDLVVRGKLAHLQIRANRAGTLAVDDDGAVYRLPLRVDWLVLGGCQAILAAPLMLLWTVLWWRRRRIARVVK